MNNLEIAENAGVTTDQTEPSGLRIANPRRVLQVLQDRIEQGVYPAGGWLPTERELVEDLRANRTAIRDALVRLEHDGLIDRSPGCRPRVTDHRRAKLQGRRTNGSSSHVVAVVLPQHETDHASREIMRGVAKVLRSAEEPYSTLTFDVVMHRRDSTVMEREACDAFEAGDIAAAIVWSTMDPDVLDCWKQLRDHGYPVIFVDRFDKRMSCDFVGIDNYLAAHEAVEYLLDLGHTRIVHFTVWEPVTTVIQRKAGYCDAMEAAGQSQIIWSVDEATTLEAAISAGIAADGMPTVMFAVNDLAAYRALEYLESLGTRVPNDMSLIGFDNIDRFSPRSGFLSSIQQPFARIGQRAAELALTRLSEPASAQQPYQQVLLPTRLIERKSCRSVDRV
jgi:DNA-binding LacI/PurR family transcriptional regulator